MKTFRITIATAGDPLMSGDVVRLTVPATAGELTVLADHVPFITTLKKGRVIVESAEGRVKEYKISDSGVLEFSHNSATVLVS